MEPIDENLHTSIDLSVKNSHQDPKFEVPDHVRMSKYENVFTKYILQIGLKIKS